MESICSVNGEKNDSVTATAHVTREHKGTDCRTLKSAQIARFIDKTKLDKKQNSE